MIRNKLKVKNFFNLTGGLVVLFYFILLINIITQSLIPPSIVSILLIFSIFRYINVNWEHLKWAKRKLESDKQKIKNLEGFQIFYSKEKFYDLRKRYYQIVLEKYKFIGFSICLLYLSFMPLLSNSVINIYFNDISIFVLFILGAGIIYILVKIVVVKMSIKYPTLTFLFIAFGALSISGSVLLAHQGFKETEIIPVLFFSVLLSIGIYLLFALFLPIDRLLLINSKTAFWSSITVLVVPLLLIVILKLLPENYYLIGAHLLDEELGYQGVSSPLLLQLFEENERLIEELLVLITSRESINYFELIFDRIAFVLSISYLIGGAIVQHKIQRTKKEAYKIYEGILLSFENLTDDQKKNVYLELKNCVYTGGSELRNLILNNDIIRKFVVETECQNY